MKELNLSNQFDMYFWKIDVKLYLSVKKVFLDKVFGSIFSVADANLITCYYDCSLFDSKRPAIYLLAQPWCGIGPVTSKNKLSMLKWIFPYMFSASFWIHGQVFYLIVLNTFHFFSFKYSWVIVTFSSLILFCKSIAIKY